MTTKRMDWIVVLGVMAFVIGILLVTVSGTGAGAQNNDGSGGSGNWNSRNYGLDVDHGEYGLKLSISQGLTQCAGDRWQPAAESLLVTNDPIEQQRELTSIVSCVSSIIGTSITAYDSDNGIGLYVNNVKVPFTIVTQSSESLSPLPAWSTSVTHSDVLRKHRVTWHRELNDEYQNKFNTLYTTKSNSVNISLLLLAIATVVICLITLTIYDSMFSNMEFYELGRPILAIGFSIVFIIVSYSFTHKSGFSIKGDVRHEIGTFDEYTSSQGYHNQLTASDVYTSQSSKIIQPCLDAHAPTGVIDPEHASITLTTIDEAQAVATCLGYDLKHLKVNPDQYYWSVPIPVDTMANKYAVTWQLGVTTSGG